MVTKRKLYMIFFFLHFGISLTKCLGGKYRVVPERVYVCVREIRVCVCVCVCVSVCVCMCQCKTSKMGFKLCKFAAKLVGVKKMGPFWGSHFSLHYNIVLRLREFPKKSKSPIIPFLTVFFQILYTSKFSFMKFRTSVNNFLRVHISIQTL